MCYGCYEEFGKPSVISPETLRVADLCKQLYEFAPSGGDCHIVTDDWNLEDGNIRFCQEQLAHSQYGVEQLAIERELLELMVPMSVGERASALGLWEHYVDLPTIS